MTHRPLAVVIEADGGSRGNPGEAAYGAVLKDAATGEVIAERAEHIGIATNNVAEYRGLIAGLELYNEHTPDADLEVRMDSKLVVEQMSGRWKIKHPDMKPLAMRAHGLAPFGTTYTWIPREKNKHADRILNEALDRQAGIAEVQAGIEWPELMARLQAAQTDPTLDPAWGIRHGEKGTNALGPLDGGKRVGGVARAVPPTVLPVTSQASETQGL